MVDSKLPTRLFGPGQEPNECKINQCFQFKMIDVIREALRPEELATLRRSSLGMLLDVRSMCIWGARFTHYLLRKQLITNKKYELWFLFGGKPWRFSLREFGMVTGLFCGKLPKPVEKDLVESVSYWDTLFIPGENPNVHWISNKLSSGTVLDPELRIQYACLLLVHAVLCPTSRSTRISRDYVELVRDVDKFLAYPWGRISFKQTLESIKSKDVDVLTNQTVAIQGFLYALQLVALKAIPEIAYHPIRGIRLKMIPNIEKSNAKVVPLIEGGFPIEEDDLCWSDEENDEKVDYLMELVAKKHCFSDDEWDVQIPVIVTPPAKKIKKRIANVSWTTKGKRTKRVFNAIRKIKRVHVVDVEARELESTHEVEATLPRKILEKNQPCVVSIPSTPIQEITQKSVKGSLDGNVEKNPNKVQGAQLCEQGSHESNPHQTFAYDNQIANVVTPEVRNKISAITSDMETKIAFMFAQEVESKTAMDMEAKIAQEVESRMKFAAMDMEAKIAQEVESRMRVAINDWEAKHVCVCDCGNRIQELENKIDILQAKPVQRSIGVCTTNISNQFVDSDKCYGAIPTYNGRKGVSQELAFIDKVQTKLNASQYENFLGSLSLYSRKMISRPILDSDVDDLIGVYPDLMQAFQDFLFQCEKYEGLLLGIVTTMTKIYGSTPKLTSRTKDKTPPSTTEIPSSAQRQKRVGSFVPPKPPCDNDINQTPRRDINPKPKFVSSSWDLNHLMEEAKRNANTNIRR